jgi:hypothetical protein
MTGSGGVRRLASSAYLCLAVVATGALGWLGYQRTVHGFTDWVYFEVGARVLVHYHHEAIYADPRFHLYADNPDLQIGPPAFWFVAAFEWLSFHALYVLFAWVMGIFGLIATWFAQASGRLTALRPLDGGRRLTLNAMFVVTAGVWAYQCTAWKHLDDAMALTLVAAAAHCIAKRRPWWLAAAMIGTAIATKPWVVILAPMLLGVEHKSRVRAVLTTLMVAIAWWAPFLIAAPNTQQALGHFKIFILPGSVLHLLGFRGHVEGWLRVMQFALGVAAASYVGAKRHWVAAPLAGLAVRVLTDPYPYGYYGLGPLVFALMVDAMGMGYRAFPTFSIGTAIVEFALPACGLHGDLLGVSKLAWAVTVLLVLLRSRSKNVDIHQVASALPREMPLAV